MGDNVDYLCILLENFNLDGEEHIPAKGIE